DLIAYVSRAGAPPKSADPQELAKQLLDDNVPAARRQTLIADHPGLAAELIVALTADLKPGKEEYRRIPWIWQVAIAAGRRRGAQLAKYLAKGTNDELTMGAVSGLSDMDDARVAPLLLAGLGHFSAGNRKLAVDALLRTQARTEALVAALEGGKLKPAQLMEA